MGKKHTKRHKHHRGRTRNIKSEDSHSQMYDKHSRHGRHDRPHMHGPHYAFSPNVISVQPGATHLALPPPGTPVLMPQPGIHYNCPPGLEYLTMVDRVVVNQMVSLVEVVTGWDTKNQYQILNGSGQQIFRVLEKSNCCERQCCGNMRGFDMLVIDNFNREVMLMNRPLKCSFGECCACMEFCAAEGSIEAPPGNPIGNIIQDFGCFSNNFTVYNEQRKEIFKILGPNQCSFMYCFACCADKTFEIETPSGQVIGCIRKKWNGLVKEAVSKADLFCLEFPLDLDVRMKATLIGATFLIDFLEFENDPD